MSLTVRPATPALRPVARAAAPAVASTPAPAKPPARPVAVQQTEGGAKLGGQIVGGVAGAVGGAMGGTALGLLAHLVTGGAFSPTMIGVGVVVLGGLCAWGGAKNGGAVGGFIGDLFKK